MGSIGADCAVRTGGRVWVSLLFDRLVAGSATALSSSASEGLSPAGVVGCGAGVPPADGAGMTGAWTSTTGVVCAGAASGPQAASMMALSAVGEPSS